MENYIDTAVGNLELQGLYMGSLFTELVSNMDRALTARVQDPNSNTVGIESVKRAYGFCTTNLGLSGLLIPLEMFNYKYVPYSSAVILELHKEPNLEPFIRV